MEIGNGTTHDTNISVQGQGAGPPIGDHRHHEILFADRESWPTLHAGSQISIQPKHSGPWIVLFYVRSTGHRIVEILEDAEGRLTLMPSGNDFHVRRD